MMAARRGNKSRYGDDAPGNDLLTYNEKQLALAWAQARLRDPMTSHLDAVRREDALQGSINCLDVLHALEFLHKAMGDARFGEAAAAMRAAGLTSGGIKQTAMQRLRENGRQTAAYAIGAFKMHGWIKEEKVNASRAARLVAATYGLPAKNDDAVTRFGEAHKAYLTERSARVTANCQKALEADFPGMLDDGLTAADRAALQAFYDKTIEPTVDAVIADFATVTKDLQEKYRTLSASIDSSLKSAKKI